MEMIALATQLDSSTSLRQSQFITRDQNENVNPGSLLAPSAFSLSMMREAFKGLLVTTARLSPSSAGQRDVLEPSLSVGSPSISAPTGFNEADTSFKSVLDFDDGHSYSTTRKYRSKKIPPVKLSDIALNATSGRSTNGESR